MRILTILAAMVVLATNSAYADPAHDHESSSEQSPVAVDGAVGIEPHRAVVQVHGIVCSFCAYGAEKSLSKLDSLDAAQFGNGVLMDIKAYRITLALSPGKKLPIREIYKRIKKAGYDPITVHVRVSGTIEKREEKLFLRTSDTGQVFAVTGGALENLVEGAPVDVQAHFDALTIPTLSESEPLELVVDRRIL